MGRIDTKRSQAARRKNRSAARINQGVTKYPVLAVRVSNKHVHAQIFDIDAQKTVASATSDSKSAKGSMTEKAQAVGAEIAAKAKKLKITKVTLDRGSKLYHGRVAAFADAVREGGVEV